MRPLDDGRAGRRKVVVEHEKRNSSAAKTGEEESDWRGFPKDRRPTRNFLQCQWMEEVEDKWIGRLDSKLMVV